MMQPFSEIYQQALAHSKQLTNLQDTALQHFIMELNGRIYTFYATLHARNEDVDFDYTITCDNSQIHALKEIPNPVMAAYGTFIAYVEEWKAGGELHESLRQQ